MVIILSRNSDPYGPPFSMTYRIAVKYALSSPLYFRASADGHLLALVWCKGLDLSSYRNIRFIKQPTKELNKPTISVSWKVSWWIKLFELNLLLPFPWHARLFCSIPTWAATNPAKAQRSALDLPLSFIDWFKAGILCNTGKDAFV